MTDTSMPQFLLQAPRYLFFTGKGGWARPRLPAQVPSGSPVQGTGCCW